MSLNFGYSPPGLGRIKKDIKMNGHKILDLPSPTSGSEPVTKSYADTHYSSGGQRGPQGPKGDKGPKGDTGLKDQKVTKEIPVHKGQKVTKEMPVRKDQKVTKEVPVRKDQKVTKEM